MNDTCNLKDEIVDRLRKNGTLDRIQAELRSAIYLAIENDTNDICVREIDANKTAAFSIIYHYLRENRLLATAAVFEKECRENLLTMEEIISINKNSNRINEIVRNIATFFIKTDANERMELNSIRRQKTIEPHARNSSMEKTDEKSIKSAFDRTRDGTVETPSSASYSTRIPDPAPEIKKTSINDKETQNDPLISKNYTTVNVERKPFQEKDILKKTTKYDEFLVHKEEPTIEESKQTLKNEEKTKTLESKENKADFDWKLEAYTPKFPNSRITQMYSKLKNSQVPTNKTSSDSETSSFESSMTKTPPSKATPSKIVLPRKLPLLREANPSTTTNLPTITAKDSLASKSSTQLSKKFDAILHQSSTEEKDVEEDIAIEELIEPNDDDDKSISF